MTPDVSQLQGRCSPKLVITGDLMKHTIALSAFRCLQRCNLVFPWCGVRKGPGCSARPGELEALSHPWCGASHLRPAVSASKQGISLLQLRVWPCYRGMVTEVIRHRPLNGKGRSHFDVQLCTGVRASALFYPEVLWWLLSEVAASAVESFPIQWCLCHRARNSALALNEVNMRGSSSCSAGGVLLFLPLLL